MFTIIEFIKKFLVVSIFLTISISCHKHPVDIPEDDFATGNLEITKIVLGNSNITDKYRMITFDIKWGNSWWKSSPDNWDAAWVFIKYKIGDGEWKHATLSTISTEHKSPSGSTITSLSDGKGVFIYRSELGT